MELEFSQVNTEQEFGIFDIRQYNFTTYKCQIIESNFNIWKMKMANYTVWHGGSEF